MRKIKVLGIGSPFGDDRLGWEVVNQLQQCAEIQALPIEIKTLDRPGMRLLEEFQSFQTVLLIDALQSGAAVGSLHCLEKEALLNLPSPPSSHAIGIAEALKMAEAMEMLPENLLLFAIEISENLHVDTALSEPIQQQIDQFIPCLIQKILRLYQQ